LSSSSSSSSSSVSLSLSLSLVLHDQEEGVAKLQEIYQAVCDACPHKVVAIRSAFAVTLVSQYPYRHVQIVTRLYNSPAGAWHVMALPRGVSLLPLLLLLTPISLFLSLPHTHSLTLSVASACVLVCGRAV
jgi:hypothetical protein